MAKKQYSDVRGVAKADRERERRAKKEAKLAERRKTREQQVGRGGAPQKPIHSK